DHDDGGGADLIRDGPCLTRMIATWGTELRREDRELSGTGEAGRRAGGHDRGEGRRGGRARGSEGRRRGRQAGGDDDPRSGHEGESRVGPAEGEARLHDGARA